MSTTYKTLPKLEYYTCTVDLLCCACHLQEAENMTKVMIFCKPNVAVWMALLVLAESSNVEMAERVVK